MQNVQLFNVAPLIPKELRFLEILSHNLWWSWDQDAVDLFRRIDPALWARTRHNPIEFLSRVPQTDLEALVQDDGFLSHVKRVEAAFRQEVPEKAAGEMVAPPDSIAYFSLEFGIHESVRLYSGGLGCLAGDHLKAASDMQLPLVAIGLMYRQGYFQQYLNADGWQQEAYVENELHRLPIQSACDADGNQVRVTIPLPEGPLHAKVWRLDVGRVPLFLLDANIAENPPELRRITFRLYDGDKQIRLRQELLLGIGGFRALCKMGFDPPVCHMNEGHAAFLCLARIEHMVKHKGIDMRAALEILPRCDVFTTHTPVPAGNETFRTDMLKPHLAAFQAETGVDPNQVIEWGHAPGAAHDSELSMTILGMRMAQFSNGVSRLHGVVARKMWQHLWPSRPVDEIPVRHVTNGVHLHSWVSPAAAALFSKYLGPAWRHHPGRADVIKKIAKIPGEELWQAHDVGRSRLVRVARETCEEQFNVRSAKRAEVDQVKSALSHDTLTIGFARRFATYKRATLLFRDPERLEAILTNAERPVQIVFAGKAHPDDDTGKGLIRRIIEFSKRPAVRQKILFLENYDIRIARYLVQGVDVWLNTPRRPQEASGTSGMKAAVNGALNLSVLDGWWDEGYTPESGWAIGQREEYENLDYQDTVEAQAIYNLLENEIIPRFYDRDASDIPQAWVEMMRASIGMGLGYFTSHRMLSEYKTYFYDPARAAYGEMLADGAARAHASVQQHERFASLWPNVRIATPQADRDLSDLHAGDDVTVEAAVRLGGLTPDEVDVEIYHGPVNIENEITDSHASSMKLVEERSDGTHLYRQTLSCSKTGRYGFTARVTARGAEWKDVMPGFLTWAGEG